MKIPKTIPMLLIAKGKNMLGKCVELLVNLPGQSKGNIGEVTMYEPPFIGLKMLDGKQVICLSSDISEAL